MKQASFESSPLLFPNTGKLLCGLHFADVDAAAGFVELDDAVFEREECEIATLTDVGASDEFIADLTNDNATGGYGFPPVAFDAAAFRLTVTTVTGSPLSFFMCHGSAPSKIKL
jgi:hypothetical protein